MLRIAAEEAMLAGRFGSAYAEIFAKDEEAYSVHLVTVP